MVIKADLFFSIFFLNSFSFFGKIKGQSCFSHLKGAVIVQMNSRDFIDNGYSNSSSSLIVMDNLEGAYNGFLDQPALEHGAKHRNDRVAFPESVPFYIKFN